jgi:hypothetical protein
MVKKNNYQLNQPVYKMPLIPGPKVLFLSDKNYFSFSAYYRKYVFKQAFMAHPAVVYVAVRR